MSKSGFSPHPELSPLCDRLWQADKNRLRPGVDYQIDPQGKTRFDKEARSDRARDPLFEFVNPEALERKTFKAFISLLDNYERQTGKREVVTNEEVRENCAFIDAIMETEPMKIAHEYLANKGILSRNIRTFKQQLYDLWFKMYRRTRGVRAFDSSGFEHVFVGEARGKSEIIGLHNWIQIYMQEKNGEIDYKGFIPSRRKRRVSADEMMDCQLLTIQFSWREGVKPMGSTFIGTSPEFEFALYTVCFLAGGGNDVNVELDDYDAVIVCHRMGKFLGSCFPKGM